MSAIGTKQTSVCALQMSALNQSGHQAPLQRHPMAACEHCCSIGHAIIHESIPASQFNFLCPSLLFAARPFLATFVFRDPRLFSSSINEGRRRKNRRRRLRKCTAANKDNGNG
jgi:hypothetical protein